MIDVHTHLWPADISPSYMADYFRSRKEAGQEIRMTLEEILCSMDQAGIDRSIVLALAFGASVRNEDLRGQHEYINRLVMESGGRLTAFCTLNPFEENALEYLEKYLAAPSFHGLKLHPNIQCFYPDDERLFPIYAFLEEHQAPVLFHTGGIGLKGIRDCYGEPARIDTVACLYPNLPIIMGHAGRIDYRTTATILRKHPHVYADISTNFGRIPGGEWRIFRDLLSTVKTWCGTTEKLLFGSDYPFYSQKDTAAVIRQFLKCRQDHDVLEESDILGVLSFNADSFCQKYGIN